MVQQEFIAATGLSAELSAPVEQELAAALVLNLLGCNSLIIAGGNKSPCCADGTQSLCSFTKAARALLTSEALISTIFFEIIILSLKELLCLK